jgi:hypothetical protein
MKVNYLGGLTVSKVKLDERIWCASALLAGSLAHCLLEAAGASIAKINVLLEPAMCVDISSGLYDLLYFPSVCRFGYNSGWSQQYLIHVDVIFVHCFLAISYQEKIRV